MAVLAVALPLAVTTWALTDLEVTTLAAEVDFLALKPVDDLCSSDDFCSFTLLQMTCVLLS